MSNVYQSPEVISLFPICSEHFIIPPWWQFLSCIRVIWVSISSLRTHCNCLTYFHSDPPSPKQCLSIVVPKSSLWMREWMHKWIINNAWISALSQWYRLLVLACFDFPDLVFSSRKKKKKDWVKGLLRILPVTLVVYHLLRFPWENQVFISLPPMKHLLLRWSWQFSNLSQRTSSFR